MAPTVILADRRDHDQTLGAVVKKRLGLTWTRAKRVIERRHVRVGGQIVADATYRVKSGKRITIAAGAIDGLPAAVRSAPATGTKKREQRPGQAAPTIEIVFADDAVIVVNKPAGLTTNRSAEDKAEFGKNQRFLPKTLADLLPYQIQPAKPIAVHRLDRDTSGLIVFALSTSAARALSRQFKAHTVERRYLALVRGHAISQRIESTLIDDRGDGRRGSGKGGQRAVTHVNVLSSFASTSLVECRLETGRTHQVRIHLGEAGTPLCGERVYDRPLHGSPVADTSGARRPMLHAASLGFVHPVSGDTLRFTADAPQDFQKVLSELQKTETRKLG